MPDEENLTPGDQEINPPDPASRREMEAELPVNTGGKVLFDSILKQTIAISFVVTIVVVIILGAMGGGSFVVKKDFETNILGLAQTVDKVKKDVGIEIEKAKVDLAKAQTEINNTIKVIPNEVTTQVNNQIAGIKSQVQSLNQTVVNNATKLQEFAAWRVRADRNLVDANEKVYELEAELNAYEVRMQVMEDKINDMQTYSSSSSSSGSGMGVDVEVVERYGGMVLQIEAGDSISDIFSITTKVKITNNTGKDIENVQLFAAYYAYDNLPSILNSDWPTLSGTSPSWEKISSSNNAYVFVTGGWGYGTRLDIKAGKYKIIYPELKFKFLPAGFPVGGGDYHFELEIECEDFDFVN